MSTDLVEAEVVPYEPAGAMTLFGTTDPKVALQRMSELAAQLVDVIEKRRLFVTISARRHVTAEGWTTLGAMVGVVPIVTWTRPLPDGNGWEARVEARTLDGRVVGAAESMCTRTEKEWGPSPSRGKPRDEFALRSMAQTRAIGRALRAPLGQIVVLAGYEPAGAEEMPAAPPVDMSDPDIPFGDAAVEGVNQPPAKKVTDAQKRKLDVLVAKLRDEGKHITTEQLYGAIATLRGVERDQLILGIGGVDDEGVLRWRRLRDSLKREEARQLIDWLETKQQRVQTNEAASPFQAPAGVPVPYDTFPEGY